MRNVLLIFLLQILFLNCVKEDNKNNPVLGNWGQMSSSETVYDIEFTNDFKCKVYSYNSSDGSYSIVFQSTYTINGNKIIFKDNTEWEFSIKNNNLYIQGLFNGEIKFNKDYSLYKSVSNSGSNSNNGSGSGSSSGSRCGTYNGKSVYKGPKGGCYYINSKGNKSYVDRSYCC